MKQDIPVFHNRHFQFAAPALEPLAKVTAEVYFSVPAWRWWGTL